MNQILRILGIEFLQLQNQRKFKLQLHFFGINFVKETEPQIFHNFLVGSEIKIGKFKDFIYQTSSKYEQLYH